MTMNSLKCSLRLQPYRQWIFVLYFVLITIIDFSCTVDGLSTTNERGERKLFGGYRITPKFCKPSKILPKGDPRAEGPTICMFNHECTQRHGEVVGACMDGFLFGACCQLAVNEAVIDDYNKPLLNPLDTFNGNDNRVPSNNGYGESDTVLIETSKPSTPEKTSIYLSSHAPGQSYSPELPSQVTDSLTTFGTTISNKKKTQNTKQPHQTKPIPSKYGNSGSTDKYVLVQTLSNDKNVASSKPGAVYDNEINSIESIILMLNDTKTGPQYDTEVKPQTTYEYTSSGLPTKYGSSSSAGNFYITTKLPSSSTTSSSPISYIPSTKRPTIYNVTYTTSQNAITSIFTPSTTPSTLATIFQKVPILTHSSSITTKSPSTSYVYSTIIPKRPTSSNSNPNRISSTTTSSKKPTKSSTANNAKKPVQKVTQRPISTSYVSGPTPSRPTYSPTKRPAVSAYTTPNKQQSSEVPIINKIGSSTPAPTVIVLGPYGLGSTENPSPTIHITPKPTANFVSSSTSWTVSPDLNKYTPSKIPNTSQYVSYSPILTKRPGQNEPSIYTPGVGPILSNEFDDTGYYGLTSTTTRPFIANIQQTVTSASIYAVVDENGFPGTATPNDDLYTSPNDLINFPPVRNPNLNATAQIPGATIEDYDISTPQFIEDELLNDKMNLLVNKIVESLKDNFHDLADIVENKTVTKRPQSTATTIQQRPITTLPTKKPPQRATTTTRRPTTLTKPTTNRPNRRTTKKPQTTVLNRVTTTKRPTTKPPKRQPTTTVQQEYEEVTDAIEESDEDVGEETAEEESTPYFESGRVQCGVRPHVKSGRIVGGKGATFGEWPWQVLVRESTWLGLFTKNKCGGVLITKNYVMTAAHCQPGFLASLVAVFGEFDISGDLEKKRSVTKNVKRIVPHREYDAATFENDLALLELESPIHYDTHIVPICLPDDGADFTGRMATVTGWGRLKYGGGVPSVLQEVQVPIIENEVCQEMFHTAGHNKKILSSFLCAGYANGQKDSCEGDSGGPLVLQRTDGRWELAGTVSHGIKCAAPYLPGVYMRTTYYKPWLESITGV